MTADEVREQKGALLLEVSETEHELANLEEKARRTAACLKALSQWLGDVLGNAGHHDLFAKGKVYVAEIGSVEILTDPRFPEAMNFAAVKETVQTIGDVRKRLADLQERKRNLGLK